MRIDLQVHFYEPVSFRLSDVLSEMERRGIDGVGLLNYQWEKTLRFMAPDTLATERYEIATAGNLISFTNKQTGRKLVMISGDEAGVRDQQWHILCIGVTGIRSSAPEDIIEETLARGGLPIIDHPFADPLNAFRDIDERKERDLRKLCERYAGKIALEWNGYCLPWVRAFIPGCTNVNRKTERLAREFNLPVVPTTDLHARNVRLLAAMGTAYIDVDLVPTGAVSVACLRDKILSRQFTPRKAYVGIGHFTEAFGIPMIRRLIWKKVKRSRTS